MSSRQAALQMTREPARLVALPGAHGPRAASDRADVPAARRSESGLVSRAAPQVVQAERLSYHLVAPKAAGPADVPVLGEAYRCWHDVWTDTLFELDKLPKVTSDEFTRQDEVGAMFHGWECVGLTGFRWIDLASPMSADDSYFGVWPREARAEAMKRGSRVCVGSNLTVAAPWRRADGASIKELLLTLAIERFLASDADVLVGTLRNDRGMNSLGYRLGFQPLAEARLHGVDVDLVAFYRGESQRQPLEPHAESIVQTLRPLCPQNRNDR
jgi:hypothetical protein